VPGGLSADEEKGHTVKQHRSIIPGAVALIMLATGCAGPDAEARSAAHLKGTWRGSFGQVMAGDPGHAHGEIVCHINADGTYKTWITRSVAASASRRRLEISGTFVANGPSVMLNAPRFGSRMVLKHDGDTLYGLAIDRTTKRITVAVVELRKVAEGLSSSAPFSNEL